MSQADHPTRAAAELDTDLDVADVADADALRDTGTQAAGPVGDRTDVPLEADPADVAEQDAAVPYDDEER